MSMEEDVITNESKEAPQLEADAVTASAHLPLSEELSALPSLTQLCVALLILAGVLGSPYVIDRLRPTPEPLSTQSVSAVEPQPPPINTFEGVSLEARAVYVWDVALQKSLFVKNAQAQLPLASLTKLMTALVAYETYGKEGKIAITRSAIEQEGENGFHSGDAWNANELIDYTLISSSNDGAYALAAAVGASRDIASPLKSFVDLMNARARDMGLSLTYFTNPTGLDASASQSGGYGSARDMAFLMEHMIKETPELLAGTTEVMRITKDASGVAYTATNTNEIISAVVNPLGSKTGYTELAGGNLLIAYDAGLNHPIVIAVLGSSREGRFKDVSVLIERTAKLFIQTP